MQQRRNFFRPRTAPPKKVATKPPPEPWTDPLYCAAVAAASYLGKKGYTIAKSALVPADLTKIYADLWLAPDLGPGFVGGGAPPAFPVFRENANKIYVPRFYGEARYGEAGAVCTLPPPAPIAVTFPKPLRDYQVEIADIFISHVGGLCETPSGGGILEVKTGRGKTVIALKIVAALKVKTLIIVHKEFLANQWAERIAEFLPGATIGRIQGSTFDVAGKDIVIGMVQTLYNRPFADTAFDGFGMTIIDEVHRIGSEEFSKTLLRIVTPVMLGISATVERKDKLERLLYMFIGERVYRDTTPSDDQVCVRAIDYVCGDAEFNAPILDFRGNPAFSPMVSRLCNAQHRTEFALRVLADLVRESPTSQIMVLAHQRAMLAYIHDAIVERGFATTGFYVGGTKPAVLKATEEKQIVLATFSMAAEALDIKTLSTLFMVTPMSNITQSVGRILRAKHNKPIIVDIVDKPDVFKRQFVKRLGFYKGNNYMVRRVASDKYAGFGDMSGWRVLHTPRGAPTAGGAVTDDAAAPPRKLMLNISELVGVEDEAVREPK